MTVQLFAARPSLPVVGDHSRLQNPAGAFATPTPDRLELRFAGANKPLNDKQLAAKMTELRDWSEKLTRLDEVGAVIGWDQETWAFGADKNFPEGEEAVNARASQSSVLASVSHQLQTSKALGHLLETLGRKENLKRLSADEQIIVSRMKENYDDARKFPESLVRQYAEVTSRGQSVWDKAYHGKDGKTFKDFAPVLQEIVSLNQQFAKIKGYKGSPYNAMLDDYSPGMTTDVLDKLFGDLKKELIPLVKAIQASPQVDDSFLHKRYSPRQQYETAKAYLEAMGFDTKNRGRVAVSTHPFTSDVGGRADVRLTVRTNPNSLMECIGAAIHEGGHGIFGQGIDPKWDATPVGAVNMMDLHESQSRIYELFVGQNKAFWQAKFPDLQQRFPKQLGNVTLNQFYKAVNKVNPDFIRVEADEVTYILHIIVRYEIEKALMEGKLKVDDVPKAWNQKYQDYLGITPPNDQKGCLQDVHWSAGLFGYFPSYALGTLAGAQFYDQAKKDIPDLEQKFAQGNLLPFRDWLNEKIHKNGSLYKTADVIKNVTGQPLDAKHFVDYLWKKYGDIYGVKRPQAN